MSPGWKERSSVSLRRQELADGLNIFLPVHAPMQDMDLVGP
jgi:hypothetical protein